MILLPKHGNSSLLDRLRGKIVSIEMGTDDRDVQIALRTFAGIDADTAHHARHILIFYEIRIQHADDRLNASQYHVPPHR